MSNSTLSIVMASLLANSAAARESSYDHVASEAATAANDATETDLTKRVYVDYSQFYGLTLQQAVEQTCRNAGMPEMEAPVFLLLFTTWNDATDWANSILHPS